MMKNNLKGAVCKLWSYIDISDSSMSQSHKKINYMSRVIYKQSY
jgi:chromatin remodeling complex protein RSC6